MSKITRKDVRDILLKELKLMLEQPEDPEAAEVEKSLEKPVKKTVPAPAMNPNAGKPSPTKTVQKSVQAPKPIAKSAPAPVQKPVAKVPEKEPVVAPTIGGKQTPAEPGKPERPEQPQTNEPTPENPIPEPKPMGKMQYQIWNTKLRMGQLDLPLLAKKFSDSLHTFDLRVTKNTKDGTKIMGFLTPTKGDLQALKGALESLEVELDKLAKISEGGEQQGEPK